ncbi:MAG: NAD(P)H nitroreductase [Spirochaetales bacterium]|jgi:nitroreductase|nr:nitroreductase family protein [Exilispira sp.]NMC67871.1 NAD(P)H nitroreductase [Spirochaetales bacterium]
MNQEVFELFKKRFSCRNFLKDKVIERDKILRCLEAARLAPSASNSQPWKYIVIDDPILKNEVVEYLTIGKIRFNQFAKDASAIIVVTEEPKNIELSIGQVALGRNFANFDIGCSVMQFCLAATDIGLATCILGIFDEKKIKKLLKIPFNRKIIVLIALGFTDQMPKEKKRKEIEKIYSYNIYK